MINFKTTVELPSDTFKISHSDTLLSFGSCFSENIGIRLIRAKFHCDVNPFGILYNPFSIASALNDLFHARIYKKEDWEIFQSGEQWHSFMHHSRFSANQVDECLSTINRRLQQATHALQHADCLLLTWGTARVYQLSENNRIVANCHKLPERMFTHKLVSVEDIVSVYRPLIKKLLSIRPSLQILFTVSPIRHAKDGFHANQISKSVLLIAIEQLCNLFPCCHYFPSYEILMDELRDYRFYADDMLHPSELAVEYIWERFCQTYFLPETLQVMKECTSIAQALEHRPFNPESLQYKNFLTQIVLKIKRLTEKYSTLDFEKELELCHTRLKQFPIR